MPPKPTDAQRAAFKWGEAHREELFRDFPNAATLAETVRRSGNSIEQAALVHLGQGPFQAWAYDGATKAVGYPQGAST